MSFVPQRFTRNALIGQLLHGQLPRRHVRSADAKTLQVFLFERFTISGVHQTCLFKVCRPIWVRFRPTAHYGVAYWKTQPVSCLFIVFSCYSVQLGTTKMRSKDGVRVFP